MYTKMYQTPNMDLTITVFANLYPTSWINVSMQFCTIVFAHSLDEHWVCAYKQLFPKTLSLYHQTGPSHRPSYVCNLITCIRSYLLCFWRRPRRKNMNSYQLLLWQDLSPENLLLLPLLLPLLKRSDHNQLSLMFKVWKLKSYVRLTYEIAVSWNFTAIIYVYYTDKGEGYLVCCLSSFILMCNWAEIIEFECMVKFRLFAEDSTSFPALKICWNKNLTTFNETNLYNL